MSQPKVITITVGNSPAEKAANIRIVAVNLIAAWRKSDVSLEAVTARSMLQTILVCKERGLTLDQAEQAAELMLCGYLGARLNIAAVSSN